MSRLSLAAGSGGLLKCRMDSLSELYSRNHEVEAPSPLSLAAGCKESFNTLALGHLLGTVRPQPSIGIAFTNL
jgi:hypothetical protein